MHKYISIITEMFISLVPYILWRKYTENHKNYYNINNNNNNDRTVKYIFNERDCLPLTSLKV